MKAVKTIWDFFQNEVLGMGWLNRLISAMLNACGLDTAGRIGGSIQFFIYDTIKIMTLLGVHYRRAAGHGNAVLLVLLHSPVYRVYKRRLTPWRYIFLFDFFSNG